VGPANNDEALAQRCRGLKLILSDVDGVMTDGTVLLLPDGREARSFHVRRVSEAVTRRAAELEMAVVRQGVSDKGAALREILAEQGLTAQEVAYIGDDLNDLPVMNAVALSAAPADAPFQVRAQAFMVLDARGGGGCLREFVEAILRARGDWERAAAAVGALAP
jgi:3-deoxy-D-manno-octulosonate 8-phosphate phosphatase (KDO 8-P phosphatase)